MEHARRHLSQRRIAQLLACACMLACAIALQPAGSRGASAGGTTFQADIVTSTTLDNQCLSDPARAFGTVLPGTGATTDTGSSVCRINFGASKASQLRISQSDGTGTAMGYGITAPTQLTGYVGPGRTLGVFGSSPTVAFAIGRQATAYRTDDGGATWPMMALYGGNWNDIETTPGSPANLWVVGEDHQFGFSTNGLTSPAMNVTWTDRTAQLQAAGWGATDDVAEVTVPDTTSVWFAGDSRRIGRYTIAGDSFTLLVHPNAAITNFQAIDALDSSKIMAVSVNGYVAATTTGATAPAGWTSTALPNAPEQMTDLAYASATRAYAVGFDGYVAVWDGTTWTDRSANLDLPHDLMGVDSIPGSPDTVVAIDGMSGVWRSTDAGLTWTAIPTNSASRGGDIHATATGDVYTTSAERSFWASHDGGVSGSGPGPMVSEELTAIATSPTDGRRILSVGTSAYRSTNAGAGWTSSTIGTTRQIRDVTLADDTTGWGVGDGGAVIRTTDLGATWTTQTVPATVTGALNGVTAFSDRLAVAVGYGGVILRNTGGTGWYSVSSGTTKHLMAVASSGTLAIAVGAGGTVLRSTDSGQTWTSVPGGSLPSTTADLLDVAFATNSIAYALTRHGVWRSTDAGLTWTAAGALASTRARAIAASGRTVVVVGYDDRVEYSTDDGATFTGGLAGTSTMHLSAVAMIDPHTAVISAADRRRLRMDVDATPAVQVPDWTPSTNDWTTGTFFGVCLQDTAGIAVADWTKDVTNVAGRCEQLNTDPWRAVPATASMAAHTNAAGYGSIDLVWGLRASPGQTKGTYEAGVAFETIAP